MAWIAEILSNGLIVMKKWEASLSAKEVSFDSIGGLG